MGAAAEPDDDNERIQLNGCSVRRSKFQYTFRLSQRPQQAFRTQKRRLDCALYPNSTDNFVTVPRTSEDSRALVTSSREG